MRLSKALEYAGGSEKYKPKFEAEAEVTYAPARMSPSARNNWLKQMRARLKDSIDPTDPEKKRKISHKALHRILSSLLEPLGRPGVPQWVRR